MKRQLAVLLLAFIATVGFTGAVAAQPLGGDWDGGSWWGGHKFFRHNFFFRPFFFRHRFFSPWWFWNDWDDWWF